MNKRHPRMTPARTLTLTGGLSGARLSKTLFCSALLSSTLLTGCGGDTATQTDLSKTDTSKPATGWNLVWSDEFDGQSIDSNKWNFEVNCAGGGNNEKQCYTADKDNAFISEGMLNIVAKPAAAGAEKPYTSARLTTKKKADFKYGRFEMKAKLPSGQGSWPAFWMMPTDSFYGSWPKSGEIDIMEAVRWSAVDELKKSAPKLQWNKIISNNGSYITLRMDQKPFDDLRVRRALNMAVKDRLVASDSAWKDALQPLQNAAASLTTVAPSLRPTPACAAKHSRAKIARPAKPV